MQKSFWSVVVATVFLLNCEGIHLALAQGCEDYSLDHRVENAPFSAERRVMTITRNSDGTSSQDEATGSEARDGKGRTYRAGERRWTTVIGNKRVQKSEILVQIVDPVANTTTEWSTVSKDVKVVHWPQSNVHAGIADEILTPFLHPPAKNSDVQKLGTKTIEGVLVEGIRISFISSATQDDQGTNVDECWYSPELKTLILEMHESRNRSFTNQLENIVRGEPVTSKYQPPADYRRLLRREKANEKRKVATSSDNRN